MNRKINSTRCALFAVASTILAAPCMADSKKEPAILPVPSVISYAPFPLPLVRTYVKATTGMPASKAREMNSPFPDDFPPCLAVALEDARPYKIKPGSYAFPSVNTLRIYRIGDLKAAPYKTIRNHIITLKNILDHRDTFGRKAQWKLGDPKNPLEFLPDYPPRNSAHGFDLHIHFLDAAWGSGIAYMTIFTQDGGNHANNDELQYIFQGLTKDGQYYIAADFRITHPKLDRWKAPDNRDYTEDEKLLNSLKEDSFTPRIGDIMKWLASLKIGPEKGS